MAMTPDDITPAPEHELVLGDLNLTIDDLGGHTVEDLVEYFDAGLTPADPSIDNSAGCQIALAAIRRLRVLTSAFLEEEAAALPPVPENWVKGILSQISVQAQAGRDVPLEQFGDHGVVVITEGAVRALVRSAGDHLPGLLVGRTRFTGDITIADEPITVEVDATAIWGQNIRESSAQLRHAISEVLAKHTHLNVEAINVSVHDILPARS